MTTASFNSATLGRAVLVIAGVASFGAGAVAVFQTDNGPGSAALVAAGAALTAAGALWDRLEGFEVGGVRTSFGAAQVLYRRADIAENDGDGRLAADLRAGAEALVRRAAPIAGAYEQIREGLPSGSERTALLEALVAAAQAAARAPEGVSPDDVRHLFQTGRDGDRIYALALMQESERLRNAECVRMAISDPRSAFEQYQALVLAQLMIEGLDVAELQALEATVRREREPVGRIKPGGDRWILTAQLLTALTERTNELLGRRTEDGG